MTFNDKIQNLANKTATMCSVLQTEEATKNALIMPFISILGYDIFDPLEVVPEFTADVGIKKGEKVDYAIKKDGKIVMLFECKHCGGELNVKHASQLFRYFTVTDARVAVLTNGIIYQFFTDLDYANRMDQSPFLEINMLDLSESAFNELNKLSKSAFDINSIIASAEELKYTQQIKNLILAQLEAPSDDFVSFFARQVFEGVLTPARRDNFKRLTKRSLRQVLNERVKGLLKQALTNDAEMPTDEPENAGDDSSVLTTAEELEGFYIVKSLLRDIVNPDRITHRDTKSYFGILLDNNNRKPLARLHFNRSQKYLGVFDENRRETRMPIKGLDDIFAYSDMLRKVFAYYEEHPEVASEELPATGNDILEI